MNELVVVINFRRFICIGLRLDWPLRNFQMNHHQPGFCWLDLSRKNSIQPRINTDLNEQRNGRKVTAKYANYAKWEYRRSFVRVVRVFRGLKFFAPFVNSCSSLV